MPTKSQANLPKNQHWVPKFYLRQFATPERRDRKIAKVWVFSKDETKGNELLKSIREVCSQRYFYTPTNIKGERIWHLENKLGNLETTMGLIWPELATGFVDITKSYIRKGLALFVAIMRLRNPEVRRLTETLHFKLVESFNNTSRDSDGYPAIESIEIAGTTYKFNPQDWHEYREWNKNNHDHFFVKMLESEAIQIAQLLMKKRWSIVFSEVDVFITSDNPVTLMHQTRQTFGFGTKDSIITFPLSPKRILVMDDLHNEPANQYYSLNEPNAGAFNYHTWCNGSRYLITGRPVPDVLSEILACAG